MLRNISHIISIVFHPLWMVIFGLLIILAVNPYQFSLADARTQNVFILTSIFITVGFPLLSILMMKKLNLISSLEMETQSDRIGPLIITGLFYLWYFVNIKGNSGIPVAASAFILGAIIALFTALFLNSFTKISLHTTAAGGFLAAMYIIRYHYSYDSFPVEMASHYFRINADLLVVSAIVIVGIVAAVRLKLNAHTTSQIYLGLFVGIVSQWIAYLIMK
ncbi:MAG TPA: hypothetical protein PK246_03120 [Saprospiraceae bacterium]|nr:hypothetical protein [Saprospiraceae bacterium]